jgi:hypothetical protein
MLIVTVVRGCLDAPQAVALGASAIPRSSSGGGHFYLAKSGYFYIAPISEI